MVLSRCFFCFLELFANLAALRLTDFPHHILWPFVYAWHLAYPEKQSTTLPYHAKDFQRALTSGTLSHKFSNASILFSTFFSTFFQLFFLIYIKTYARFFAHFCKSFKQAVDNHVDKFVDNLWKSILKTMFITCVQIVDNFA